MRMFRLLHALLLVLAVTLAGGAAVVAPGTAWAQDDDDDDGGGRSDDDDDDGPRARRGGDRPALRRPARTVRARPPAPAPVAPPAFAPNEIVSLTLDESDLATLVARGYVVLEERPLPAVGLVARRLATPPGTPLETARAEVRGLATGNDADFNHYYRGEQAPSGEACDGPHCPFLAQIGWTLPPAQAEACLADVGIGVIDTGINAGHAAFAVARLDVHRLAPEDFEPSRAVHGTAVLALLVGDPASRSPGLLPGARVVAVDAFHRAGRDERADVFTLAAAMDLIAGRDARVVNMSLAGPPNTVLERAVAALSARGVVIVAATGNGGPQAPPAYPAAYPGVVAVTAVDRRGNVYRRAGRGAHVDLAAPGVDVWTAASVSGARPKTGTSFAAPFVTAAAAALAAKEPDLSGEEIADRLRASALDLGDDGVDEVYGHGLVQAALRCSL